MTQRQRVEIFGIIHGQNVPLAVAVIILCQSLKCLTRKVGARDIWDYKNTAATTLYTLIKFDVLITHKTLIIESIFLKHLTSPTSKRHGVYLACRRHTCSERGIAYTETIAQHLAYGKGLRCLV